MEALTGLPWTSADGTVLRCDVYRPMERSGPLPVVLYLHGGGFRAMSKDTHWLMGLAFARRGYVVIIPDYRQGTQFPFPTPALDACAAWTWATENAERLGGDPTRMAVAGESAGANLAATVAVASAWERPEPWARAVFDAEHRPLAALPACGILQVSDTARFRRRRAMNPVVHLVIEDVERTYLGGPRGDHAMADPLLVVERSAPSRPPPPFFLPVGTWDPLLDDTRRMAKALRGHGVRVEERYYPREVHAFHAFVWRKQARTCWQEMFGFLDAAVLPPSRG